jgi:hypothetical protein
VELDIDRRLRVLGLLYIFSFLSTYSIWNGVSGGRYIEKRERERERCSSSVGGLVELDIDRRFEIYFSEFS